MGQTASLVEKGARLVNAALAAGADHAEAYLRQGGSTRITLQQGHVSESMGMQEGVALRVWCADRLALQTADGVTIADPAAFAGQAVALAQRQGMLSPAMLREEQSHQHFDGSVDEPIVQEEKVAELNRLIASMRTDQALTQAIINACYADETHTTALVNSHGFSAAYRSQQHSLWIWIEGAAGHAVAAASSRRWAGLDLGEMEYYLCQQAALLGQTAGQAPTGLYEVLFSPLAAADLARALGWLLTAENVLRDLNVLLKYIDQQIAAPAVTLIDDSTLADGSKSRPIDDEGTPTGATRLIERGRLRTLLHTRRTAARLGVAPNGKAVRGALWEQPHGAPSNIYLQAGDTDPAALRQAIRRGLIVEGVMRPGRIQSTTGKFTIVVQGWWVEQGNPVRRVSGVPLSANIFALLRNVRCCGSDLHFSSLAGGAGAPSLLIEQMQVG